MNMKARAQQIKTFLPAVYLAARSPLTPKKTKVLAALTMAYALSPMDLIPDFIPVLGYLDDLVILPAMIAWTVHSMPKELFDSFLQEAQEKMTAQPAKKWAYAIPTICIYALILYGILHGIFHVF
jgi:uncharacterized membrane protein YkvA (DUF1232 family)